LDAAREARVNSSDVPLRDSASLTRNLQDANFSLSVEDLITFDYLEMVKRNYGEEWS